MISVRIKRQNCIGKGHDWLNDKLADAGIPPVMLRTGGTLQWFDHGSNEMVWEYYEPHEMQLPRIPVQACPVCRRPLDDDQVLGSCANTKDGSHRRVRS